MLKKVGVVPNFSHVKFYLCNKIFHFKAFNLFWGELHVYCVACILVCIDANCDSLSLSLCYGSALIQQVCNTRHGGLERHAGSSNHHLVPVRYTNRRNVNRTRADLSPTAQRVTQQLLTLCIRPQISVLPVCL